MILTIHVYVTDWSAVESISQNWTVSCPTVMFSQPSVPMDMTSIQHNVGQSIDHYYSQIIECKASRLTLNFMEYIVPGWNDISAHKHAEAREAYLNWVHAGKVRSGPEFCLMKRTRSQFKLALRYCRQHQETIRADAFAQQLCDKDYNTFRRDIKKYNNGRCNKYASTVGGCTGEDAIAEMWRSHFKGLFNSCLLYTSDAADE